MNHGSAVPDRSALAHFKVRPSYATDAATATALVAEIIADAGEGLIAVDLRDHPAAERAGAPCGSLAPGSRGEGEGPGLRRAPRRGATGADGAAERRPRSRSPRRSWLRCRAPRTTPSGPVSIRTVRRRGSARSTAAAPASP